MGMRAFAFSNKVPSAASASRDGVRAFPWRYAPTKSERVVSRVMRTMLEGPERPRQAAAEIARTAPARTSARRAGSLEGSLGRNIVVAVSRKRIMENAEGIVKTVALPPGIEYNFPSRGKP